MRFLSSRAVTLTIQVHFHDVGYDLCVVILLMTTTNPRIFGSARKDLLFVFEHIKHTLAIHATPIHDRANP